MHKVDFNHFLDKSRDIAKQMPKEARELFSFLSLVIDITTRNKPSTLTATDIRCPEKGCYGLVKSSLRRETNEINWYCPTCEVEGVISGWQETKWGKSISKK